MRIGINSVDDLGRLGVSSMDDLAKLGINNVDDLAKLGIDPSDLKKIGIDEDIFKGGSKVDSIIDGLKVIDGKVDGKIPIDDFKKIRAESIQNISSDTITLGKYEPTVKPDGTLDWTIPGSGSYTVKAGDTTYFSLGSDWDVIKIKYNITDKEMFKLFNVPALDDAIKAGKKIRFSHDPRVYKDCALVDEWKYLKSQYGFKRLMKKGEFWYATK